MAVFEALTGEDSVVHRVLVGKPQRYRSMGRPRCRWEVNYRIGVQKDELRRGD